MGRSSPRSDTFIGGAAPGATVAMAARNKMDAATARLLRARNGVDCVACFITRDLDAQRAASCLAALLDPLLPPRGGPARAVVIWDARWANFEFAALERCGAMYRSVEAAQRGRVAAHVVLAPDESRLASFVAALLLVFEPATPCYVAASIAAARATAPLAAALLPDDDELRAVAAALVDGADLEPLLAAAALF